VITGHTHQAYNCELNGKRVTSASSSGRLVTDIDLQIDRRSGDVISATANNVIVTRDVAQAPAQTELIDRYKLALGPIAGQEVGTTATALTRQPETLFPGALGESVLGNVIADAQLAATDGPMEGGAVAAFMNPGGVREDLDAGPVTYGEAFTVQPFANNLVTLDLTGAQLQCLLEQQFQVGRTLYPSATVSYVVDPAGTTAAAGADPCSGTRVPDDQVTIGGTPWSPARPTASRSTTSWPAAVTASPCSGAVRTPSPGRSTWTRSPTTWAPTRRSPHRRWTASAPRRSSCCTSSTAAVRPGRRCRPLAGRRWSPFGRVLQRVLDQFDDAPCSDLGACREPPCTTTSSTTLRSTRRRSS
jgi:hypothetical protein